MSTPPINPADYHSLLQEALVKIRGLRGEIAELKQGRAEPIAIVGAGCRFPGGVSSPDEYWRLLESGTDAITRIPADRWNAEAFYHPEPGTHGRMCTREGGFIDSANLFDAGFFGMSRREAEQIDPQQRLLLEVSWEALENSAIAPDGLNGSSTGVYVGIAGSEYATRNAHRLDLNVDPYLLSGTELSNAAGRIASYLGLQGPALAVATACSSSLVSIHLAAHALNAGECDLAIAGGVNLIFDPAAGIILSKLRALAPDGRSKPFDAGANGYGRGEGCGLLVLERLSAAVRNRRRILAVIRGSAVSHDGSTPSDGKAYDRLLQKAFASAGVAPQNIDYLEAHGGGTALGDPVELESLARVAGSGRNHPLFVGSVKTNIGHLEAASGVAGVLKTALALSRRRIPPHLHFQVPNPRIPWRTIPIQIPVGVEDWPEPESPRLRLAGVSAFGRSGINAHVVLEEAPSPQPVTGDIGVAGIDVLTISARSRAALEDLIGRYAVALAANPLWNWTDVCRTSNLGRAHFEYRTCVTALSLAEGLAVLKSGERTPPDPNGLGRKYLGGGIIDWTAHHAARGTTGYPVDLPTYPFERQNYRALFPEFAPEPAAVSATGSLASRLRELPAAARTSVLIEALSLQVGALRGFDGPVDSSLSLSELGVDWHLTAHVQEWLCAELGIELSLDHLLSSRSIDAVAQLACTILNSGRTPIARVVPEGSSRRFPLTHGQQALWFIHESDQESSSYNVGLALRFDTALDPEALEKAIQKVVARHPSLRSTYSAPEGEPEQEIAECTLIRLTQTDATDCTGDQLKVRVSTAHELPFNLVTGPVFRAELFTCGNAEQVLLLSIHHIACDALSCWTIIDELFATYTGTSLPPLEATYIQYLDWQRKMLDEPAGEALWKFWRQQLEGELPVLSLPLDFPRPAVQTFVGASHQIVVGPDLLRKLRDVSRVAAATLHNVMLAAYATLLCRYAGQEEVIIGCATAGRPAGFAGVVGYFTNPIPIRVDLSGNLSFSVLVAQVRQRTFDGIERQQLPFALIVQRLLQRRDLSRSPIFQADFSLLKNPPAYRGGNASQSFPLKPFPLAEEEGQFDMGLHITENDFDLSLAFKYNTALFLPKTIETLAACYLTLLEAVVDDPRTPVGELRLLSPKMLGSLVSDFNQTAVNFPETPVHRMFERQVTLTPDAVAAVMYGTSDCYTYAELNLRANQLAHRLGELRVGPEVLVGVCIERSLDLAVAILAVLKAGGAYVPLDPAYPAQRLEFMVLDAGMPVVLTTERSASRFSIPAGVVAVRMDAEWPAIAGCSPANPAVPTSPNHLAYVIYTSGSTGLPKGALIEHRGLTNYLNWSADAYRAASGCGAPVSSSISFDATVTSFFTPLITGGKIVLLPEDNAAEALTDCLRASDGFSLIKITPAHLEILRQSLRPEECSGRAGAFVIGGEALRADMLDWWQEYAPGTRLINEYGPTETVVGCCFYEATGEFTGPVPIGRPIANTELYVLGSDGKLVPPGVVGELYIGGAGVARGYHNRPDLTNARFVPDHFSERAGARLFRTGDMVRLRPDGNLEFLGRLDHQVKIRGYRIELGEIESTLAGHPAVKEAAAMLSNGQIAAYFTSTSTQPVMEHIRHWLTERLPGYMVPSFLVALDQFRLTPNGKIDRSALPAPEVTRATSHFVAPREPLELKIAAIWEQVLGIRPVGVKDNFFDLGGHSLLAVQLAARLAKVTGQRVPLNAILRGPTVEQLAGILRREAPARVTPLVPIQPSGSRPPFYCVPGAGGNVIYLYNLARHLGPDQPFYGLQGVGFEGEAPPHHSVEEMAAHYLRSVQEMQPSGPYFLGGHSLGGWVAYEMAQQLLRCGHKVGLVVIVDTPTPIPGPPRDVSGWTNGRWLFELADRIGQLLNPDLHISLDALESLHGAEQLEYFRAALATARIFPEDADSSQIRNVLEMFKAHTQVRYRIPDRTIPVRVALLRTTAEPPDRPFGADPSWGWSALAPTDVSIVPGEHLSALRTPHVQVLADRLMVCLDDAQRAAAQPRRKAPECP